MKTGSGIIMLAMLTLVFSACNNSPATTNTSADSTTGSMSSAGSAGGDDTTAVISSAAIREQAVSYSDGSATMNGYITWNESVKGPRAAVLVVPEWWGLNDYVRMRAKKLAELGYVAFSVDLYGNGKIAATPDEAMKYAGPFYGDPKMAKSRFDAALAKLKTYPETDTSRIAAIGYCFGGSMVLNMAKLGDDLKAVVSFHGGLKTVQPKKGLTKAQILVCHGGADSFVPPADLAGFRKQLDSVGARYEFKTYEGATHAFTNPDATANGKKFNMPIAYNAAADTASWKDMQVFFDRVLK